MPDDDDDVVEWGVVHVPEPEEKQIQLQQPKQQRRRPVIPKLTPPRLLDWPWPERSSVLGKRGCEDISAVHDSEDEEREAWAAWAEKINAETRMEDICNFAEGEGMDDVRDLGSESESESDQASTDDNSSNNDETAPQEQDEPTERVAKKPLLEKSEPSEYEKHTLGTSLFVVEKCAVGFEVGWD